MTLGRSFFCAGQRGQIRWQNGNVQPLQESVHRIVFMFTVRCENGRLEHKLVPSSHAVIRVDGDRNEIEKHDQLSVTAYGECKEWQAAACHLCE